MTPRRNEHNGHRSDAPAHAPVPADLRPGLQLRVRRDLYRTIRAGAMPRVLLRHPAWITLLCAVALTCLGIYAINLTGGLDAGLNTFAKRQLVFFAVALFAAAVVALPHYRRLNDFVIPLTILVLLLLIVVLLPLPRSVIPVRNGATRWVNLGFTDFQPSELVKVVFVLAIAWHLQRRVSHRTFLGMLLLFAYTAIPVGLIVVEPDLGTASLFVPALMAMLIAAGSKLRHLFFVAAMGVTFVTVVVGASMYLAARPEPSYPLLREHQVRRIQAMANTLTGDESGADTINYQGDKARTIVGAGRVWGIDEHTSRATVYFNALPEDHNDMIFAVICNRFGFVGGCVVIGLHGALALSAFGVAAMCRDPFGRLTAVGFGAMLATQATVNIGMTVGLLPITGMTLPFVSYGGSSLVTGYLMIGLIVNIAMRPPAHLSRESFEFDSA
ncbi:MAG: FtsW/RodA/SpoVE family cell cycle protein [Phycisphaerales bacterium]|nr:FtsW/RodA/SpoVE family cell cycle protein [Phycisphaerales bacterium]